MLAYGTLDQYSLKFMICAFPSRLAETQNAAARRQGLIIELGARVFVW